MQEGFLLVLDTQSPIKRLRIYEVVVLVVVKSAFIIFW